ncbi:MAG: YibE/F family protein [Oscillospiraceae bacterium]|nr:YibE/F family protein [Oscillospiraceae bacterium]
MNKQKRKSNWVFCVIMLIICSLMCLLPEAKVTDASRIPREKVRIESVDNSMLFPVGLVYSGTQSCTVTILTGEFSGQTAQAFNYMNSALDKDKLYREGDIVRAMVQKSGTGLTVTLIDHQRTELEIGVVGVLGLSLILFGGMIGCGALISLAGTAIIVWKILIPLLLQGINPMGAAFVTVVLLTVLIDMLVAGWSRRCAVAILGSLSGTVITCLAAILLTDLFKLDGGDVPYLVPLLSQSSLTMNAKSLYIGMIFLANSGALMDLSMDIAVSCEEICFHKPDISRKALLKSGLMIGRGVLGTMTTTLMLAYSGNYLSMLMYFAGQGTPVLDVVNLKYVAGPMINTVVGSFGLVAAAPLTALIAAGMYCRTSDTACIPAAAETLAENK